MDSVDAITPSVNRQLSELVQISLENIKRLLICLVSAWHLSYEVFFNLDQIAPERTDIPALRQAGYQ